MLQIETLTLEIGATRAGLKVIKPPVVAGNSGVKHSFSFLASSGSVKYAIDVYEGVSQMELLRTYAKKIDTGTTAHVVCVKGKVDSAAVSLAKEYNMRILRSEDIEPFFKTMFMKQHNGDAKDGQELGATT